LPTKFQPQQVSDWIWSKKKDTVPPIKLHQFLDGFIKWWKQIQPSWRTNEGSVALDRKTPKGETWQVLRKGGMSGIYVVIMALSWWIKAQQVQRDNPAWMAVDDLSWVIQQMMLDMPKPVSSK